MDCSVGILLMSHCYSKMYTFFIKRVHIVSVSNWSLKILLLLPREDEIYVVISMPTICNSDLQPYSPKSARLIFTKIFTIILSENIVLTLRAKLRCRRCNILNVREIFVLSFIVSETIYKKMNDALTLQLENKRVIHRQRIFSDRMTNIIAHIDKCLLK